MIMEFSKVYKVNKTVSEKEFLREVLVGLSNDPATPVDIMTAKFGEVREATEEFFSITVDVDVNYSGSVGYDRQETYTTQDNKRLEAGDRYYLKGVMKTAPEDGSYWCDVEKTRTVTDWQSHSGCDHFSVGVPQINSSVEDDAFSSLFGKIIKYTSEIYGDEVETSTATLNKDAERRAVAVAEDDALYSVKWPGDHQKDQHYTFKSETSNPRCYICPYYIVDYEYKGKKYIAKGFAFGNANEIHEAPVGAVEVASEDSLKRECTLSIQEAQKKPMLFGKIGVGAFVLGMFVTIIGFANVAAVGIIGLIILIGGLAGSGVCYLKLKSIEKHITNKYAELIVALQDQKAAALEKKLEEMGLEST